jgi:chemotaxis protein CheZ
MHDPTKPMPAATTGERQERLAPPDSALVGEVVSEVLASMQGDLTAPEASLLAEVEELGRIIAAAKAEIAELRVEDITEQQIPSATDELDAIVAHTASATEQILESCETLDRVAGSMTGGPAAALQSATTRIYEACSFQDITGQRITKVVSTLHAIETKVAQIIASFGPHGARVRQEALPPAEPPPPAGDNPPMHGPQLPVNAMDHRDIDKLLASFD